MNQLWKSSKYLLLLSLRLFAFATCLLLFVYFMLDIYEKFAAKMTNIGVQTHTQKEDTKPSPCITVCLWQAFKRQDLFYSKTLYYQQTFEKEDIFADVENATVFNASLFSLEEILTTQMGRCYMVCHLQPLKRNVAFYLSFRKTKDIKGTFCFWFRLGWFSF